MKASVFSLLTAAGAAYATPLEPRTSGVQGFDISSYQGSVDFSAAYKAGARFVMIKVRQMPSDLPCLFSTLTRV
jgi:GH25 family lysozyme M1 (1,4-beta-N-acetylmuramidase)